MMSRNEWLMGVQRLCPPTSFLFKLSESSTKEIRDAMRTWSADLRRLTKVARHLKVTSQVRQLRERHSESEINCYPEV